jgi:hypothetical protein
MLVGSNCESYRGLMILKGFKRGAGDLVSMRWKCDASLSLDFRIKRSPDRAKESTQ